MQISHDQLKSFKERVIKVKLVNGNYLRGNFRGYVETDNGKAIDIETVTYKFQINENDIDSIELVSKSIW